MFRRHVVHPAPPMAVEGRGLNPGVGGAVAGGSETLPDGHKTKYGTSPLTSIESIDTPKKAHSPERNIHQ